MELLALVAVVVTYFSMKRRARNKKVAESERLLQTKRTAADSAIAKWLQQAGEPTRELWRSIGVVHVMVVEAPRLFRPFFVSSPDSHEGLASLYGLLGVAGYSSTGEWLDMATAPWLISKSSTVPRELWENPDFQKAWIDTVFICRGMALRRGWRG